MKNQTAKAYGRVEVLGNHTDYNDGFVISALLNQGVTVSGLLRNDEKINCKSRQFQGEFKFDLNTIKPNPERHWTNYLLGVVSELQKRGVKVSGFSCEVDSDLPIGAGLASSGAFEVATLLFLQKCFGFSIPKIEMAKVAQAAEHNYVGVRCGLLDQISSLFGKPGSVLFIDFRSFDTELIILDSVFQFIIVHTGVKHELVAGEYNLRRQSCEKAAKILGVTALRDADMALLESHENDLSDVDFRRAKHIIGENERVLWGKEMLRKGNYDGFGKLMLASHISSRNLFENSCPELDFTVESAMKFDGCLGARLSGGGFGGATINLILRNKFDDFCQHITKKYQSEFGSVPVIYEVN